MLLGEEDGVCRDAVVGHPSVTLQHPNDDVWEAVLGLDEGRRAHREEAGELNLWAHKVIQPTSCRRINTVLPDFDTISGK